ncbi:hypothetical protein [Winogradskyella sp. UBA3174]|uniref:hypothetical protein n=1 Tax=Winogradskyella sp. UBA3174 TaxID=1947785 RepID=UPI0025F915F6|nr:hypothetical protein [Winogradskyella sp. UBA3174]|tara:strand:- start:91549 stop:91992 length:444 start_codon:yes stop_codon:yes gene_type:complete
MGFSLSKLFGNKASKTESNDSVEAIIKDVENKPFGVADTNVIFAGLNELGGYYFFQTVIVGELYVKIKDGATLTFKGENFDLKLNSDMPEFESGGSPIPNRSITKIDFQIEESDVKKLEKATLSSIALNVKKNNILFTKYVSSEEEE